MTVGTAADPDRRIGELEVHFVHADRSEAKMQSVGIPAGSWASSGIQGFGDISWVGRHWVVSVVRQPSETSVPVDILLVRGTCIINEAMLSGESTPLLKESIELLEGKDPLDVDGPHRNAVLFSGTKVLQSIPASAGASISDESVSKTGKGAKGAVGATPDGGCLGVVLRTGFGTSQGELVRTMIFSTERVSANNFESFLFIGFLLIFAIAASWYVWVKGQCFPSLVMAAETDD
jgi:magnesium-transporting ATPase (P-type)